VQIEASKFNFEAPAIVSRARRVLIQPNAGYTAGYPVTTSREMIASIIEGVREISDADIILLGSTPDGSSILPIYNSLGYDFPRVLTLDVKDCIPVEVDNPLPKPLAIPTFWVPNVVLSSDYLISTTPLKISGGRSNLSIMNLLSILPRAKYSESTGRGWSILHELGIDKVLAELYFTLRFDMGIIEARQKFVTSKDHLKGVTEHKGRIYYGEPYQLDSEVAQDLELEVGYLKLIEDAKQELEEW
jgi:uncharacterized protein (DUF362 family)